MVDGDLAGQKREYHAAVEVFAAAKQAVQGIFESQLLKAGDTPDRLQSLDPLEACLERRLRADLNRYRGEDYLSSKYSRASELIKRAAKLHGLLNGVWRWMLGARHGGETRETNAGLRADRGRGTGQLRQMAIDEIVGQALQSDPLADLSFDKPRNLAHGRASAAPRPVGDPFGRVAAIEKFRSILTGTDADPGKTAPPTSPAEYHAMRIRYGHYRGTALALRIAADRLREAGAELAETLELHYAGQNASDPIRIDMQVDEVVRQVESARLENDAQLDRLSDTLRNRLRARLQDFSKGFERTTAAVFRGRIDREPIDSEPAFKDCLNERGFVLADDVSTSLLRTNVEPGIIGGKYKAVVLRGGLLAYVDPARDLSLSDPA